MNSDALLFKYPTYLILSLTHTYPIATATVPVKFVYSTYVYIDSIHVELRVVQTGLL